MGIYSILWGLFLIVGYSVNNWLCQLPQRILGSVFPYALFEFSILNFKNTQNAPLKFKKNYNRKSNKWYKIFGHTEINIISITIKNDKNYIFS